MANILVADDERSLREVLDILLSRAGHEVILAEDGQKALNLFQTREFDLVVSDIRMPVLDGLELLKGVKRIRPGTPVVLISAYAGVDTAVEAIREGAYDFIPKPFKPADMRAAVDSALANKDIENEREALTAKVKESQRYGRLVGSSPAMLEVYDLIQRASHTNTSILITGESGTGKELVACTVHENSPRAEGPFVAINCGSVPEHLVESELFGYKKGAFTGANTDKTGLMLLADQGSLFLDELAELTPPIQVKLLRAVQEKSFRPVGGDRELSSDVRFIAATNKNLEVEVMAGRFREDLYYRLNVINIRIPPLREREGDIPLLAHFFLEKHSKRQNKNLKKLSVYALDVLSRYNFPGNVRELENIIERSVALEQSNIILPESLRLPDFKRDFINLGRPAEAAPTPPGYQAAGFNPLSPATISAPLGNNYPPHPNGQAHLPPAMINAGGLGPARAPENYDSGPYSGSWPAAGWPAAKASELELPPGGLTEYLSVLERHYLWQALLTAEGTRGKAASLLHISSWRLRARLANHIVLAEMSLTDLITKGPAFFPKPVSAIAQAPDWTPTGLDLDAAMMLAEGNYFMAALKKALGNKTEAAAMLGISRRTLQHRLDRSGIKY